MQEPDTEGAGTTKVRISHSKGLFHNRKFRLNRQRSVFSALLAAAARVPDGE
jgi:hypothetical protein